MNSIKPAFCNILITKCFKTFQTHDPNYQDQCRPSRRALPEHRAFRLGCLPRDYWICFRILHYFIHLSAHDASWLRPPAFIVCTVPRRVSWKRSRWWRGSWTLCAKESSWNTLICSLRIAGPEAASWENTLSRGMDRPSIYIVCSFRRHRRRTGSTWDTSHIKVHPRRRTYLHTSTYHKSLPRHICRPDSKKDHWHNPQSLCKTVRFPVASEASLKIAVDCYLLDNYCFPLFNFYNK